MITKSLKPLIFAILIVSIILIAAQFFQSQLIFYRDEINAGNWWRLITGNFTHSNYPHLLMNLAGLWIIGFLFVDSLSLKTFTASLIILSAAVGLGLYFFSPELQKYYGLSGVLYGLFLVGATTAMRDKDWFTGLAITVLIIAKIIWDMFNGGADNASAELIGMPVAVDAHLYGVVSAAIISLVVFFQKTAK